VLVLVVNGVLEEARPLVEATVVALAEVAGAEEAGTVTTIVDVCTEVEVVTPPEQDPQGTVTVCVM